MAQTKQPKQNRKELQQKQTVCAKDVHLAKGQEGQLETM